MILESAMEAHALIRSCRETIKKEGLVVNTLHGSKAHPLMNAQHSGTVRISVCERAIERYAAMALMKRSPKMTAN